MWFIVMFITAVCVLFLIKLWWPKKNNIYKKVNLVDDSKVIQFHVVTCYVTSCRTLFKITQNQHQSAVYRRLMTFSCLAGNCSIVSYWSNLDTIRFGISGKYSNFVLSVRDYIGGWLHVNELFRWYGDHLEFFFCCITFSCLAWRPLHSLRAYDLKT